MTKRRVNVRGIIWRDGKLLTVKHKTDGGEANYWAIPGGGLDPIESLTDGMVRELVEETGITPKVGKLLFVQQFAHKSKGHDEQLEFFFHIENAEDFTDIDLSKTTHGETEIARIGFVDATSERVLPEFLTKIDLRSYIETDKPVYFYSEI